jgi:hypothetical protein
MTVSMALVSLIWASLFGDDGLGDFPEAAIS